LAQGDYLVEDGSKCTFARNRAEWRWVFNNITKCADKEKRLYVKELLDRLDHKTLEQIRDEGSYILGWEDWQRWFLCSRHALEFCHSSRAAWIANDNIVILIPNQNFSSATSELRTYVILEFLDTIACGKSDWEYAYGLNENSHVFFEEAEKRVEIRYLGHLPKCSNSPFLIQALSKRSGGVVTDEPQDGTEASSSPILSGNSEWNQVYRVFLGPEPEEVASKAINVRGWFMSSETDSAEFIS
jgi:hypothetical protein